MNQTGRGNYYNGNKRPNANPNKGGKPFVKFNKENVKSKTYRTTNPKQKIKLPSEKYILKTKSFKEGIVNMRHSSPVIDDICTKYLDAKEEYSIKDVYEAIIALAKENCPNIEARSNMLWEFQITGNKVYVKTDKFLSFGWFIKSTKVGENRYTTEYTFNISIIGENKGFKDTLLANGWAKEIHTDK